MLWGFCRARRPKCHRSRLIYPPPLSSCYAWSLNFPFLLFFLCFCSQIPPRPLHPLTPLLSLPIFFFLHRRLAEHDTGSTHATIFSSPRAQSDLGRMSHWMKVDGHKCDTQYTPTPENSLECAAATDAPFPDVLLLKKSANLTITNQSQELWK